MNILITFFLSFISISLIVKYSKTLGLVDIPNERSSHKDITPRGAGIGFGLAIFIGLGLCCLDIVFNHLFLFLAIFLVYLIGILDDHKDASPKAKFYVIFVSTLLIYLDGFVIDTLGYYFGYNISLGYFALPFTIFALAGFTNALNLIDGLDGLSSSISIIILGSFLYVGYIYEDQLIINLCLFTIVSLTAFLFYNWSPAKIFMGDSGSLLLGFIISIVAVSSIKYIHPISVFYLAAIPILDTVIVMFRRVKRKISPFTPDKMHIHHILLNFFSGHIKKTVLFLILIQTLFSLVGILLLNSSHSLGKGIGAFIALAGFIGIIIMFYIILTGMSRRQNLIEKLALRKKK